MSIRWKTFFALLLTGMIPLIAFSWFAQTSVFGGLRDRIVGQLQGFSQIQAARVADSMEQDQDRLALVCSRTQLRITLKAELENAVPEQLAKIERIIGDAKNSVPKFERISVAGLDGVVIGSTDPAKRGERIPDGSAFQAALAGEYGAEFRIVTEGEMEKLKILLCGPMDLDGARVGVAAVWSNPQGLTDLLEGQVGLGEGGESRLLRLGDQDEAARSLVPLGADEGKSGIENPAGIDFLAEMKSGVFTDLTDSARGTALLAAVEQVPGSNLAVLTFVDSDSALAPAFEVRRASFAIAGLALLAMLGVAVWFARSITNPVRRLTKTASRIHKGQLDERAEITTTDEIGELGLIFNEMTEELVEANRDLERKVAERTKELKSAQMLLVQSEKLESLGRLAAGVAHEVKNPLQVLRMGLDYCNSAVPSDEESDHRMMLDLMDEALDRADEIVQGMVDVSRAEGLKLKFGQVNELFGKALLMIGHRIKKKEIQVEGDFQEDLPEVLIDKNKLEQVLINLISNATFAIEPGGQLFLKTFVEELQNVERQVGLRHYDRLRENDRVVVMEVRDTGPGIPEENLRKLFDPFFTTKAAGEGTGLGLSVSKTIVDLHHGTIEIENVENPPGARARIFLKIPDLKEELKKKKTANTST